MKITEVAPHPDLDHAEALRTTGFWGKAAAGCMFLAKNTGRLGLAHRSMSVEQPGTFGTVGGAIDPGEDPALATVREAEEEVGYRKQAGDYLVPLDVFQSGTFRYTTFLYVVEQEFRAELNWEAQGFTWFEFGQWPEPIHFGIAATIVKPFCANLVKSEIMKYQTGQAASAVA